jgi:hypothetical protein
VVVDVAEVPLVLVRHPRQTGHSADQAREHVPLGCHGGAHPDQKPLHREDLLQLFVAGVQERLVLEPVDAVVEVSEDREEAVDEPVDDPVEQQSRIVDGLLALLVAPLHLCEGGRLVAMDGDHEALGIEAVHLDQTVLVRNGAVDDQEYMSS